MGSNIYNLSLPGGVSTGETTRKYMVIIVEIYVVLYELIPSREAHNNIKLFSWDSEF